MLLVMEGREEEENKGGYLYFCSEEAEPSMYHGVGHISWGWLILSILTL